MLNGVEVMRPAPLRAVETGVPTPLDKCPAELADGWLVHAAALRRRLNTLLFPGQALMVYEGRDPSSGGAFAHGVPNTTWLSAATLLQDKRMTRDLLAEAGIPVPAGRTFSLKRGRPFAKEFAAELGYPVRVKPMIGESTVEVFDDVQNEASLDAVLDYLDIVPTRRPDFTTSSYAFTQILTPRSAESERTRGTYRYVVEETVPGEYVRFLLVRGEVVSCLHLPEGPWGAAAAAREILEELHPDFLAFAQRVAQALPGLAAMALDVRTADFSAGLDAQQPVVIEVSERPWLQAQCWTTNADPDYLAGLLLKEGVPDAGETSPEENDVTVVFRWEGLSKVSEDARTLEEISEKLPVALQITEEDSVSGILMGRMEGAPRLVALLNELAAESNLLSAPAMAVETRCGN